jgi:hypothetical protein
VLHLGPAVFEDLDVRVTCERKESVAWKERGKVEERVVLRSDAEEGAILGTDFA